MEFLIQFIKIFFNLLIYAILGRILLSWFSPRHATQSGFPRFLHEVTEPVLRIARRLLPPIGMMDFSPILALLGLQIIRDLLIKWLIGL